MHDVARCIIRCKVPGMMALAATSPRLALASYTRFITTLRQRHRFVEILVYPRYSRSHVRRFTDNCVKAVPENANLNPEVKPCPDGKKKDGSKTKGAKRQRKTTKRCDIAYEPYWEESSILKIEQNQPEMVVRGTVIIPAFATSEARIVRHQQNTVVTSETDSEKVLNTDKERQSDDNSPISPNSSKAIEGGIPEHECRSYAKTSDSANKGAEGNYTDSNYVGKDTECRNNDRGIRIFGFLSRNRAFHGDEVVGIRQRRLRDQESENAQSMTDQCRVVRVTKRSQALSSFVGVLDVNSRLNSLEVFKCQPQDTRWPAFNVYRSGINPELLQELESLGKVGRILCLMRFDEWHENDMEPKGRIIRIIGDASNPDAQMEASMTFHGLNPNGFSDAVIQNLKNLIESADGVKEQNRIDYRDHLVFTIDPQDAKDLDDALSVEVSKDGNSNYKYRLGVHIADVSHYVRGGSLVDLDARQRATSVYLEHRVFPMLPHLLSENLCSLLPNSEKLCFSMFADLVDDPSDGEMVGSNLYIRNQSFVLTRIISRKRLSYQTAKDIIYRQIQSIPDLTDAKMESMSISDFQSNIIGSISAPNVKYSCNAATIESCDNGRISDINTDQVMAESQDMSARGGKGGDNNDEKLSTALLILYFVSRKLRQFRLKQRGAVMVDINGSQKCHIPRVDGNTGRLWMEQIPKESHELVEEMMLLANTQAAQLLAKSFDRYFLRVHENTSNAIKQLVTSMMPQDLRKIINPDVLHIPELLRKCAKHMEPTAFQSLSFAALQQFKEAVYSPVNKDDKSTTAITGHWGLALPMYLHFTSPIRRYSDLYTHRMLKTVLDGTYTEQSLKVLDDVCNQCNLQKRKAFDVQKDYKNFAFNQYLRWACTTEDGTEPYAATDQMFARCLSKEGKDVWGMVYDDACVFSIILNDPQNKDAKNKSSIIFYISMLNEQRSVSCDALNIEPIEAIINGEKMKLGANQSIRNPDPMVDGYLKEVQKRATDQKDDNSIVQAITVVKGQDQITFSQYQKLRVVLIPGLQMWTVRLPSE